MKTSEDKLNEALRAALKRKFDHFEGDPNPDAFGKIRVNLKAAPQWRYLFFTLLFVGLAIVGIVADQHFRQNSIAKTIEKKPVNVKANAGENNLAPNVANVKAISETDNIKQSKKLAFQNIKIEVEKQEEKVAQTYNEESVTAQGEETLAATNVASVVINPLDIQPGIFESNAQKLPNINVAKNDIKPVIYKNSGQIKLVLNAAVLQSYQILTVPSGAQSFQNFDFPSTFSLRSLGYKLSIGAETKGFQFLLHYSRFKQDYSYEIAGNDYVVETIDKDNFKVIRQGTRVSQENQFSLLGIGVNKQVTWGNAAIGKYYASAGLEYSYGLIRKQSIGWINAGIGKQFPISKNRSLQIGPYAEFSPVKFTGSGDPFFYQPYRVGISAGLRLNR